MMILQSVYCLCKNDGFFAPLPGSRLFNKTSPLMTDFSVFSGPTFFGDPSCV